MSIKTEAEVVGVDDTLKKFGGNWEEGDGRLVGNASQNFNTTM